MNTATVSKWGNTYGIRITKNILEQFPLKDKEKFEVHVEDNKLVLIRIPEKIEHKKLEDLLKARGWQGESFEVEPVEKYGFVGEEVEV